MNRYLIYLRKSQKDSPEESVESVLRKHEIQLQEYAQATLGYKIPEKDIYREVVSGETIKDRIEINKVLDLIEQPSIAGVIVIEPQRLGRGDLQDCGFLVNAFRYSNTLVMTPPKTYDLTDKFDRKFFEMELQRGSDYLEYYKEIQARGRLASIKRGNFIGSIPPFGYKKIQGRGADGKKYFTLEIIPEQAAAVRLMYDLFINYGYGYTRIATELETQGYKPSKSKHWSPAAIKEMLANPVYCGKLRWNWRKSNKVIRNGEIAITRPKQKDESKMIVTQGKHEAIIDEETYRQALSKQGKNVPIRPKAQMRNYLAGLIYCQCGKAMILRPYYDKSGKQRGEERLLCPNQPHCGTGGCLSGEITFDIMEAIRKRMRDITLDIHMDNSEAWQQSQETRTADLAEKIRKLEIKELSLWEKYTEENMPKNIFEQLIHKNEEELSAAKAALSHMKNAGQEQVTIKAFQVSLQEALLALEDKDTPSELKNLALKKCISRITYYRERPVRISQNSRKTAGRIETRNGWTIPEIKLDIEFSFR